MMTKTQFNKFINKLPERQYKAFIEFLELTRTVRKEGNRNDK